MQVYSNVECCVGVELEPYDYYSPEELNFHPKAYICPRCKFIVEIVPAHTERLTHLQTVKVVAYLRTKPEDRDIFFDKKNPFG